LFVYVPNTIKVKSASIIHGNDYSGGDIINATVNSDISEYQTYRLYQSSAYGPNLYITIEGQDNNSNTVELQYSIQQDYGSYMFTHGTEGLPITITNLSKNIIKSFDTTKFDDQKFIDYDFNVIVRIGDHTEKYEDNGGTPGQVWLGIPDSPPPTTLSPLTTQVPQTTPYYVIDVGSQQCNGPSARQNYHCGYGTICGPNSFCCYGPGTNIAYLDESINRIYEPGINSQFSCCNTEQLDVVNNKYTCA